MTALIGADGKLDIPLIKKIGYGALRLKPSELWVLSACELYDMYFAHMELHNEEFDSEMQRTAWFTSLLMNASGNYKKTIKPEKLYVPLSKKKEKSNTEYQKDYVQKQREELKRKFNID